MKLRILPRFNDDNKKKDKDVIQNYFEGNLSVMGAKANFVTVTENEEDISAFPRNVYKSKISVIVVDVLTGNMASRLAFDGASSCPWKS